MRAFLKIINIVISLIIIFFILSVVYGNSIDFVNVFKIAFQKFPSFLLSVVAIVPAVMIAYNLSKYSVLRKNSSGIVDSLISDLPVFVVAIVLQLFVWTKIFIISSYHSAFLDIFSSFVPTFLTFILIIFIQFRVSMHPIVVRLKKAEFVRTYKSVGMSNVDISKRLSRNIDVEMSKSVKGVVLMALGESLVVENLYNFRGIGYEMLKSLKESDVTTVAGLLMYVVVLLIVISIITERNLPE